MLGTKDIEKVMIKACEALEIVPLSHIFVKDDFPEGMGERLVIHVKEPVRGDIFYKGFVELYVVIPDDNDRADHESLNLVEKKFDEAFRYDTCGEFDGQTYRYGLYSMSTGCEPASHYHYVNARLTFESLNI